MDPESKFLAVAGVQVVQPAWGRCLKPVAKQQPLWVVITVNLPGNPAKLALLTTLHPPLLATLLTANLLTASLLTASLLTASLLTSLLSSLLTALLATAAR